MGRRRPCHGRRVLRHRTDRPGLGIAASSLLGGTATSGFAVVAGGSGFTLAAYRALFATPSLLSPVWLSLWLGLAGATVAVAVGLVINLWTQFRGKARARRPWSTSAWWR